MTTSEGRSLRANERRARIREILSAAAKPVPARELATRLGVSDATVERDLADLRRGGVSVLSQPGRTGGAWIERLWTGQDGTRPPEATFVGRRRELAELIGAHDRLDIAGLTLALVSGVQGIGKSRLVLEVTSGCEARGTTILRGSPLPRFASPPLWPWIAVLRSLVEAADDSMSRGARELLVRLEGGATNQETPWRQLRLEEFQLFQRVTSLISSVIHTPTIAVFDDLQEADQSTLKLLEFVVASQLRVPLLLIGIYDSNRVVRGSQLRDTLGTLTRNPSVARIRVGPLSAIEATDLIRARSPGKLSEQAISDLQRVGEGNPFFIGELVRQAGEDAGSRRDLPDGIRDVVGGRLDQLSGSCVIVLGVASVIGRSFRIDVLEHAVESARASFPNGVSGPRVRELLDEAATSGLVVLDSTRATGEFSHGLIHEVVLQDVPASVALAVHGAIATAVERIVGPDGPAVVAELAHHYLAAGSAGDLEKAVRYSLLAGRQAMSNFAFPLAAHHFENVLGLGPGDLTPDQYFEARGRLGQALAFATPRADKQKAVAILTEAVEHFLSVGRTELAAEFALTEVLPISPGSGEEHPTRMVEMLERVIPHAEGDDRLFARLLARQSIVLSAERRDLARSRELADTARRVARRLKDAGLLMAADRAMVSLEFRSGTPGKDYPRRCSRLIADARLSGDIDCETRAHFYLTSHLMGRGSLKAAAAASEHFLDRAGEYREPGNLQQALGMAANLAVRFGQWELARELASRNVQLAGPNWWALGALTAVAEATGDDSERTALADAAAGGVGRRRFDPTTAAILLLCNDPLSDPRVPVPGEGLVDIERVASQSHTLHEHLILASLIAVVTADAEAADRLYQQLDASPFFIAQPLGIHPGRVLARLDHHLGRPESATARLNSAIAYYVENDAKPEIARALADAAELGITPTIQGDRLSWPEGMRRSAEIADELGMLSLQRRLEAHRARRGRRERAPGGLSEREVGILRLVAVGHSNRAIAERLHITQNTVTRHLTNVFTKIGVDNRTEAAAFAHREGLVVRPQHRSLTSSQIPTSIGDSGAPR